ncbi:MAG: pilus assembly protein, partial [Syntrophobacteria bacterium]
RVANLISYIRGKDSGFSGATNLRKRTTGSRVWKLGDIIHSTPTPIDRPVDNYDLIYKDKTYADFYKRHKERATVVYCGANDGMLHAFLAGVFHPTNIKTGLLAGDGAYFEVPSAYGGLQRGDEIWAYIPQNLLPHLKWLADPDYTSANHVYYVDLKPKVFDARIYEDADETGHPLSNLWASMTDPQRTVRANGWATLVVGGMRFGGGSITVTGDFDGDTSTETRTFHSAFFCIDITDPLEPILLWERNYSDYAATTDLGFTTSVPAVLKVDEKSVDTTTTPDTVTTDGRHWYLVFGSGPTWPSYEGTSSQNSRLFLVDLATGDLSQARNPGRIFTQLTSADGTDSGSSLPANSMMGSAAAVDVGLDYSVNVAYVGETHESGSTYDGGMYRLKVKTEKRTTPDGSTEYMYYNVDPSTWTLTQLFDGDFGITAAPAAAMAVPVDIPGTGEARVVSDALWVYFGTGRYFSTLDNVDTSQQYIYGVKDPCFNNDLTDANRITLLDSEPFDKSDLFDVTGVKVFTDGSISGTTAATSFSTLQVKQNYGELFQVGWYRELELSRERIIKKPSVLGGVVLAPSFVPNDDICGFGGDSYLYALYFETGTAYFESVIGLEDDTEAPEGEQKVKDKTMLGTGLASSLGIHVGREAGARGFIQQSTGTVSEIDLQPPLFLKSGFVNWRER